jgi:ribA/ribD-fused uncharacterized protein
MSSRINTLRYKKSESILFNSYISSTEVLSNHHICELRYEGKIFKSSEHLFFWFRLYGHPEHQNKILEIESPKDVKKTGTQLIKRLMIVDDIVRDVQLLRFAIRIKYNYCTEFREYLNTTYNKNIVEYAWWGDDFYGCFDEDINLKYNLNEGWVVGKNVCGRLIKEIRDEQKDENGMCILTRPACLDAMNSQTLF